MIILCKKLWDSDHIIKITCSNNWDNPDTSVICNCAFIEIRDLLTKAKESNKPAHIICDFSKGELPTFSIAIQFAKSMASIKNILSGGLECTIMYITSENTKSFLDSILKLYTPIRPIHVVNDKNDIKKYIISV
jgi:hypothetical protein